MFERYTEKARRAIFFARYEASQFGSPYIETEHLLLGLLRADNALAHRFIRSHASFESIRKQVEEHTNIREKLSTSVDLPLSNECKLVLAYAGEEAERLTNDYIGTEHLLLGILCEEECFAAVILRERGLKASAVREELARAPISKAGPIPQGEGRMARQPEAAPGVAAEPKPSPAELLVEQYKLLVDYRKYLGDQLLKMIAGIVGIPALLIGLLSRESRVTLQLALGLGAIVFFLLAFVVYRLRRVEDNFVVAMHTVEGMLRSGGYELTDWPSETKNAGARIALVAFLGAVGLGFLGYLLYLFYLGLR